METLGGGGGVNPTKVYFNKYFKSTGEVDITSWTPVSLQNPALHDASKTSIYRGSMYGFNTESIESSRRKSGNRSVYESTWERNSERRVQQGWKRYMTTSYQVLLVEDVYSSEEDTFDVSISQD